MSVQVNITILKFSRKDCGPCRALAGILAGVEEALPENVRFVEVDADAEPEKCREYGVRSVPAILFESNGEVLRHLSGVVTKEKFLRTLADATAEAG
jgi:thioredoxin 1